MQEIIMPESLLHICFIMLALSIVSLMVGFVLIILDMMLSVAISENLIFSFLLAGIVLFVVSIIIIAGYSAFSLLERMW